MSSLTAVAVDTNNSAYMARGGVLFNQCGSSLVQYPAGSSATSYTVPSGVTCIVGSAMSYCTNLTNITIPSTVTSMGEYALAFSAALQGVYFHGNTPSADSTVFFEDTNVDVYYSVGTSGWSLNFAGATAVFLNPMDFTGSLQVTILPGFYLGSGPQWQVDGGVPQESGATIIGLAAGNHTVSFEDFQGYSAPASEVVSVNSNLTTELTVTYASQIFTIVTTNGAVTITGGPVLYGNVTVPGIINSLPVTRIGDLAFADDDFTSITLPPSITSMGTNVFEGCQYLSCIAIPTNLSSIPEGMFLNCTSLTNITIPDGVTSIGSEAFAGCTSLATVTIPASVTNIGDQAFEGCGSLSNIWLPANLGAIGEEAFAQTGLTSITIPASVTNIGDYAFGETSLARLFFLGNAPSADAIVFVSDKKPIVYYLRGATGWSSRLAGRPAVVIAHALIVAAFSSPPVDGATSTGVTGRVNHTLLPISQVSYWVTNFNNGQTLASGQALLTAERGVTNWVITNLLPGVNIIAVQATDVASNRSSIVTRRFFYEVLAATDVQTQGSGGGGFIIHNNVNTNVLNIGQEYLIIAKPDPGSLFGGWTVSNSTSSTTSSRAALSFVMESNLTVIADFETNIFLGAYGNYNGLFAETNNVTEETAGMLSDLIVRTSGAYSGRLRIAGVAHPMGGSFDAYGNATNKIPRAGGEVVVEMNLNPNTVPPTISGVVLGTNDGAAWSAPLSAELAASFPDAEYTMLIPPSSNAPVASPGGYGYALITNHADMVRITGGLADGTTFSQTAPISSSGDVPLYVSLYGNTGLLLGWINLNLTNSNTGLTWIHPTRRTGPYQNGFTNQISASQPYGGLKLSLWSNPPAGLEALTNVILDPAVGHGPLLVDFRIAISNNLHFGETTADPFPLTGSINPKTGLLKLIIGSGESRITGYGAILLNVPFGGGYYLTSGQSQAIGMSPILAETQPPSLQPPLPPPLQVIVGEGSGPPPIP
jgi:hypothetical protein